MSYFSNHYYLARRRLFDVAPEIIRASKDALLVLRRLKLKDAGQRRAVDDAICILEKAILLAESDSK